VAGLALITLQVVLMGTFTSVKNMLPEISGYIWDMALADLDAILHGGLDPWLLLTALVSRPWALHAVEFVYASGWMVMIGLVPAIVALSPKLAAIRVRFFITYILCWILLGNLLAVATMSAGPAYFGEVTGDFERFRPLLDQVAANAGRLWSAFDIQRMLWHAYENDAASLGSGISAFPSLHVAMATLWAIVAFERSWKLGIAALVFLAFILVGSVALGWHYAIDGYASIILTILIWKVVGWLPSNTAPPSSRGA
jgi:membrane-associated phospholipid phosphatase